MVVPLPAATASNMQPNLLSLSRIRNRGPSSNGIASRSCFAAHWSVGCRVTLKWTTARFSRRMIKKAKIGLKAKSWSWRKSQAQMS